MRNLEEMLRLALLVPMGDPRSPACVWGAPTLLWGDPGIGKTERIRHVADSVGLHTETVIAATRAPEDFSGASFLQNEKLVSECILHGVRVLAEKKRGVLYLDELTCAMPSVQAAALTLVHERKAGDTQLAGGVRVLAAANPTGTAAGGWLLEPTMANRFTHIEVPHPMPNEWVKFMLEGPEPLEPLHHGESLVRDRWEECYGRAVAQVTGFMSSAAGSSFLYTLPPENNPQRSRAWASSRTWTTSTRILATAYALNCVSAGQTLILGTVGHGPAAALFEWLEKANLPTPQDMCAGRWEPDPFRPDINMAAVNGLAAWLATREDTPELEDLAGKAWGILQKVDTIGQLDVAVPAARKLEQCGLGTLGKPAAAGKPAVPPKKSLAAAAQPLLLRLSETSIALAASK